VVANEGIALAFSEPAGSSTSDARRGRIGRGHEREWRLAVTEAEPEAESAAVTSAYARVRRLHSRSDRW